ncbi:hypothetical protein H5410_003052 [Solanum commersonii]|uniref:Uncharacterized protein n=1 Tax=Solanum commersonii TaxID=4109 RepID=A0A9J6B4M4_SOLCO|nr:hypothetical protein H5410_003052 [Solanum commersonii]
MRQLNSDQQQVQQQDQAGAETQINAENNKEKQQGMTRTAGQQDKGSMENDMGAKASNSNQGNTPKSKNKPSKKRDKTYNKTMINRENNKAMGKVARSLLWLMSSWAWTLLLYKHNI